MVSTADGAGGRAVPLPSWPPLYEWLCARNQALCVAMGHISLVSGNFSITPESPPGQTVCEIHPAGIVSGHIGFSYSSHRLRHRGHNHLPSLANVDIVSDQVRAEVQSALLLVPLPSVVVKYIHVSLIGLAPKVHNTGRWRRIVDLSSPGPNSVNHGIPEDRCSWRYASMVDALHLIRTVGLEYQLLKMDLKDAYKVVPVHPDN